MEMNMTQFTGGLSLGLFAWLLSYTTAWGWGFFKGLFYRNYGAY